MTSAKKMAACRLLLKGAKWMPLGLNTILTADHRSSPDGPVIHAFFLADLEGNWIVTWRSPSFTVQEVNEDGSVAELDLSYLAHVLETSRKDFEAKRAGAIGISGALTERRHRSRQETVSDVLKLAALDQAAENIYARFNGKRVIGVSIFESGT